jgi:hypothetical protein
MDLEQKLSKYFSKDWKRETCKVSLVGDRAEAIMESR